MAKMIVTMRTVVPALLPFEEIALDGCGAQIVRTVKFDQPLVLRNIFLDERIRHLVEVCITPLDRTLGHFVSGSLAERLELGLRLEPGHWLEIHVRSDRAMKFIGAVACGRRLTELEQEEHERQRREDREKLLRGGTQTPGE